MKTERLPRGVRRRGGSLVVFLTHADGRRERRSLGNVSAKFAAQQREVWTREIAESRYVKPMPRVERVTFSAIADAALEHAKNYKRTWDADASRIKRMKEWWGDQPADSITTQEVDAKLLEAMRALQWTETTSNEYRVVLSHIYKLAIDRGELTVNPAAKAHRYKLNNARERELTYAEEDLLRKAIRELYPDKEPEFDLALHTGVRRSNLYGVHAARRRTMDPLDWSAVDLDWKVLRLPRSKAGPGYSIPLDEVAMNALKILRQRADGTGPVIRKPSGLELHSCRKWFETCVKRAALADFRYHDIRHTFASRLRRNRVPIEDIAAVMGHGIRGLGMTLRYAHADMDRLHEAVATLVKRYTKSDTPSVLAFPRVEAL